MSKTPAVKFLDLIFRNNFLSSILEKCVRDESCRGDFPPTSGSVAALAWSFNRWVGA